jgi:uncharacterized protein DUF6529
MTANAEPLPGPPRAARWLLLPLLVGALVSLTLGLLARQEAITPGTYPGGYFRLFFSDSLHLKVWFATAALVLALLQLVSAASIFAKLPWRRPSLDGKARLRPHPARRLPLHLQARLPEDRWSRPCPLVPWLRLLRSFRRQGARRPPTPLPELHAPCCRWSPLRTPCRPLVHERTLALSERWRRSLVGALSVWIGLVGARRR